MYEVRIKTTSARKLYPIIYEFCKETGLTFSDAKHDLKHGAIRYFNNHNEAVYFYMKYRKLGCEVELIEKESSTNEKDDEIIEKIKVCRECGSKVFGGFNYCVNCGKPVKKEKHETEQEKNISDNAEENSVHSNAIIPDDAVIIKKVGSWIVYYSKSDHYFYIETSYYFAAPLKLSEDDLLEFLEIVKETKEEIKY